MEAFTDVKEENFKPEMEYEDEPMDVNESQTDGYCEEGEINSSDDEKSVSVQMPSNISSIFTRHYEKDQVGGFVTGFNIFGRDEALKKLERAKRFCLPVETNDPSQIHKEKLTNLYRDLGIDKENERHYRFNAVHMRGTEDMSTDDVLQYFISYAPSHVEWINDISCNIVWIDDVSAARALLNLSKKIKNLDKVHLNADPFEKDFKNNSPKEEENDEDAVDARDIKTAIPPGFWRIGVPCKKSSILLLRYATRSDKKLKHAEKNSEYYKKYGNPHYGNIPGLISNSLRSGIKRSKSKTTDSNSNSERHPELRSDKQNPWQELAYEWGKSDEVEKTKPQYIKSNIVQKGASIPDLRISLTNKKEKLKRIRMELETSSNSSDKETWESRRKVPRMKMYADDEEKKLGKNSDKRFQNFKKQPKEDLRSKINRKKIKPRFKFRSEKKVESVTESSSTENEFDDADSGDWALEHYHDLRESLEQNRRQGHQRYNHIKYDFDSEGDDNINNDEHYKKDFSRRSPLQIEIENDEYYLKKD